MHPVSVIIPTYNGKHKILKTLWALEAQTFKDFETVIVIDGSTDGTKEVLGLQDLNLNLKIHKQENQGRASVRNKGAALATGELLVFFDDDMLPEPDSIQRHINFHQKNDNAICGGNQLEDTREAKSDFDRFRCYIRNKWLVKYAAGVNLLTAKNIFLTAANFSIKKEVFAQLGRFDNTLTDAEDYIFAHKAMSKNVSLYFDKDNIAFHNDFCSLSNYIIRKRQYTKNFINLAKSYPKLFEDKVRVCKPPLVKKMVFKLFSSQWLVTVIENEKLFFLPKRIRYRIYDLVTTSLGTIFTSKPIGGE